MTAQSDLRLAWMAPEGRVCREVARLSLSNCVSITVSSVGRESAGLFDRKIVDSNLARLWDVA